jgi:hypothetical protein
VGAQIIITRSSVYIKGVQQASQLMGVVGVGGLLGVSGAQSEPAESAPCVFVSCTVWPNNCGI